MRGERLLGDGHVCWTRRAQRHGERRVHETGAGGGIGGARGHVAHKRVPPSLAGTAVASLEPRQSDSRLLLFASLACALVMVSSLTLLRMLKRMGGSWSEGRTP